MTTKVRLDMANIEGVLYLRRRRTVKETQSITTNESDIGINNYKCRD